MSYTTHNQSYKIIDKKEPNTDFHIPKTDWANKT